MRQTLLAIVIATLAAVPSAALATPFNHGDDRWAVIIGIDHFQGQTRPNVGSVGDAQAFQELLRRNGWREDRVRVLTDRAATAAGMRAAMQWLVDNCSPTSYCLFHYSGHVKQMGSGDYGGGPHEYLWPHDGRFISDDEFAGYMKQLKG
ncbi:MAG: caspase family protein, partial [Actinomycetota bacterium]|nr:caspase family protein [Actinomycetota bacterium]